MKPNILKDLRKIHKKTQADIAIMLGITRPAYTNIENGRREPDNGTLITLSNIFNVSIDYLLGKETKGSETELKAEKKGIKIPVFGRIQAGVQVQAIENILDYEEITEEMALNGEYFALKIKDNSMEPQLFKGDMVIIQKQLNANSGDIVVNLVNRDDAIIRKIKKQPEGIMLIPLNSAYEPMFYTNEQIKSLPSIILGKVVELRRRF